MNPNLFIDSIVFSNMKHVIFDTDIGGDPDDLCALLLALNSPELKIDLIITNDEYAQKRAQFAKSFISIYKKKTPPVISGIKSKASKVEECFAVDSLINHYDKQINIDIHNEIRKIIKNNKITYYICLGCQSNISKFINNNNDLRDKVKIIIMGGSLKRNKNYSGHNIRCDIESAVNVFNSNWSKKYILGDITHNIKISINRKHKFVSRLLESKNIYLIFIAKSINLFLNKYGYTHFWLHDPLTVSSLIDDRIIQFTSRKLSINEKGVISISSKGINTLVSDSADYKLFWKVFMERTFK